MSFEEKLKEMLVENGMFPEQAADVLAAVKANPDNKTMEGRWHESTDGYPPQMLAVLWMMTKMEAVKWIDANLPMAWFRPMFV